MNIGGIGNQNQTHHAHHGHHGHHAQESQQTQEASTQNPLSQIGSPAPQVGGGQDCYCGSTQQNDTGIYSPKMFGQGQ